MYVRDTTNGWSGIIPRAAQLPEAAFRVSVLVAYRPVFKSQLHPISAPRPVSSLVEWGESPLLGPL